MALTAIDNKRGEAASLFLFIVAAGTLCVAAVLTVAMPARLGLQVPWGSIDTPLLLAIAAYFASHFLRALRLAVLAGNHHVSLRRLTLVHFFTAAVSLTLPLKLGEIYRVIELNAVIRSFPRAVGTVWIERCFDVGFLCLVMLVLLVLAPGLLENFDWLGVESFLFIGFTVVVFLIVPSNLKDLSLFIIRRYRGEGTVNVLQGIGHVMRFINAASRIVRGRYLAVGVLTMAIWSFELVTISVIVTTVSGHLGEMLGVLLTFLSTVSGKTSYFVRAALDPRFALYSVVVRVPLLFAGLAAALIYAPGRLREILPFNSGLVVSRGSA